ncbi:MAG: response regulator [Nitrospira sp.]|nr:response regulator [Nitrospira sp.]
MVKREREIINVLLVEDNPADVRLMKEALMEAQIPYNLYAVNDGQSALDFLRKAGLYAEAQRPDLILLDLNIPKVHGLEVLREIKYDSELLNIPVIVLTSSEAQQDIDASYGSRANSYVTKPVELEEYFSTMARMNEFWCDAVALPGNVATS